MDQLTTLARILIVDDEPAAIDLLRRTLERPHVSIVGTTDPRDAIRLFNESRPDLVLLDLIMPGIDGLQLLKQLRAGPAADPDLPILVVTGHPEAAMRRAALAEGASDLITKPYDPMEVALRVRHLLQMRALHQQLARERAELLQRSRTKNEFLSRMSHELHTPLNAILGFAEVLDVAGRTPEDAENIRQILGAGRHLLSLVDGLLEIPGPDGAGPSPAPAGPAGAASNSDRNPEQRFLFLYIEDNPSNLRLMKRILARRPEVMLLHSGLGRQGLALAREHRPALILLDLHLPDISGDQVLDLLLADPVTREVPVVVVSADATPATTERLLAAGAAAFLIKPLNVAELVSLVDRFVGGAWSTVSTGGPE